MKETKKTSKVLLFLLALVIAVGMWLYVITVVSPESEAVFYNVPVVLQGEAVLEDRKLMLIMEEKPTITLTLTGNRSDLNKLNSSNITVTADLSRIYEAGDHQLQYNIAYPGDVANGAITVKTRDPGSLSLKVEKKVKDRAIPVEIRSNGTVPATGFQVMETSLDRENILITGPASVVDRIAMAAIDVSYSGRNTTFGEDYFITLCDDKGMPVDSKWVEVDSGSVYLTAIIHRVKQIPLRVEVLEGGGATLDTSEITMSADSITVSGTEDDLKLLDEKLVDGALVLDTIDLALLEEDTVKTYKLELPEGVQLQAESSEVTVTVKFPQLTVMEILVQQIEFEKLPENLEAKLLDEEGITVKIRGLASGMASLMRENITIYLDMTDAKVGEAPYVGRVVVSNDQIPGAGALGTYTVNVSVEEKAE